MKLDIVPFEAGHVEAAATILATRHRADRAHEPMLPKTYEEIEACRDLLARSLERPLSGVAAMRGGRLVGYVVAELAVEMMERVAVVLPHGAAIAQGEDPELYRQMYEVGAERWVKDGYFEHFAHVAACDRAAVQAWFSLGFGQYSLYNWRDLTPVVGHEAEIMIRRAGPEALDDEEFLRNGLRRYNASSPIFHPLVWRIGEEAKQTLEAERSAMADERNVYLMAYQDSEPVGLMIFTPPAQDYMLTPEGAGYLHIAFVDDSARSGGIGAALVNRGLAWVRDQGYGVCTVGYFAPNLLGARFWQGKGFKPLGYCLERRIDERVVWAHGREESSADASG